MWLFLLQSLGKRVIYQGGSCIIFLVNALRMHFHSSAWQYPLYFMADSNRNCLCAVGFGLEASEPLALVPLLLPRHQSVSSREMYPGCLMHSWQIRQCLCQALWETAEHMIRWQCIMQGKQDFSYSFFPGLCDYISDWFRWILVHMPLHLNRSAVVLSALAVVLSAPPWLLLRGAAASCVRC